METEIKEESGGTCQPTEGQRLKKRIFLLFLATDVVFIAATALYWVAYVQRKQDDRPIPPMPVPKYIAQPAGALARCPTPIRAMLLMPTIAAAIDASNSI